ncbi:MAG: shikimate dehydrogenase [Nitrospirae bacterium]|nr:MAG: shikimate dehydrogenase [Nitrospirota bacterium]
MTITGRTKITGIFGYPVEHTLSPAMHNAAFEHLGLDYCYLPFLVRPEHLGKAVDGIRALSMAGVSITVPHKETVIPFLDQVSEEARFIGAVNTIVNSGGRLFGHNTDGRGFMRSLAENRIDLPGKKVLVTGAGGAARAICYYLGEKAGSLTIYNRSRAKAESLASDLSAIRPHVAATDTPGDLGQYDIIINATSLGLKQDDPLPFDAGMLRPQQVVCDLIYKRTRLLEAAEKRGCRTLDGLGMLLYQGVLAFELWTSVEAPVAVMKNGLLRGMGN